VLAVGHVHHASGSALPSEHRAGLWPALRQYIRTADVVKQKDIRTADDAKQKDIRTADNAKQNDC